MSTRGVDSAGHPDPHALRAAGYGFICRYLSTPGNRKNLTADEAKALRTAGVDIVMVWESDTATAHRPLLGGGAGAADGLSARAQAAAVGAPPSTAVYAAVDFDPTPEQMGAVLGYLRAFARACAPHPLGVYGGYRTIDAAHSRGLTRYLWQAGAWSGGKQHPAAVLRQHLTQVTVGGVLCDTDTALSADYGGWATHPAPTPHPGNVEDDMAQLVQVPGDPSVYLVTADTIRGYSSAGDLAADRAAGIAPATVRHVSLADLKRLKAMRGA